MKTFRLFSLLALATCAIACNNCSPAATQTAVKTALTAADELCVITQMLTLPDATAIADACKLEHSLEPSIAALVADRKAALARAGYERKAASK